MRAVQDDVAVGFTAAAVPAQVELFVAFDRPVADERRDLLPAVSMIDDRHLVGPVELEGEALLARGAGRPAGSNVPSDSNLLHRGGRVLQVAG